MLVCWSSGCEEWERGLERKKDRVTLMQIEAAERERCSSIVHIAYHRRKSAQDASCNCARLLITSYLTIYWLIYTSIKPVDILEDTQLQIDRVHSSRRIDTLFMHILSQSLTIWTCMYIVHLYCVVWNGRNRLYHSCSVNYVLRIVTIWRCYQLLPSELCW